jgi:hypothetical protein
VVVDPPSGDDEGPVGPRSFPQPMTSDAARTQIASLKPAGRDGLVMPHVSARRRGPFITRAKNRAKTTGIRLTYGVFGVNVRR